MLIRRHATDDDGEFTEGAVGMSYDWQDDAKGCYDEAIRAKRAEWLVENIPGVKRARVIGRCELMQGDCLEIMPHMDRVDACLTDPPYGIDYGNAGGFSAKHGWASRRGAAAWDKERPSAEYFDAMLAISKEQIIWGGNYFSDLLPATMRWLAWDKGQRDFSLADMELAWTSQKKAVRVFTYGRGKAVQDGKQHPTQKPVALMEWCLGFLPNADTILDPFMGSGTTLVACAKLGRKGIGIELDEAYWEIACKRVEDAYRQPDLFVDQPKPQSAIQEDFGL
jgi:DNA modification methylase